jgi:predicted AlkP superfamily phosphohydrolase/phosphomutase
VRLRAWGALVLVLSVAAACSRTPPESNRPKLVILGFDGLDPKLVREYVDAGQMPAFARLMKGGGLYPLETTVSPESPTAWASFATGVNPGKHNIYDFLVRDTNTYLPDLGMVRREPPKFLFDWIPIRRPKVISLRGGTSFWVTGGAAGVRSSILTVPITFPPEDVPNGELLSGLPLPDIRGTMGTFSYFATDLSRYEEGNTEFGGILRRLSFEGNTARSQLVGPPNPIIRTQIQEIRHKGPLADADRKTVAELETKEDVSLPLTVTWTRGNSSATIDLNGTSVVLKAGAWSKWIDVDFRINFFVTLHGMVQMYLIAAGDELQLYVSPVNWRPDAPPVVMSAPASFAADLYKRLGPYRTLGWAEATWPLNEGRMDEATFMDDLNKAFDDRANVILDRLNHRNWDLLVGVIESTDRVQHMMYRLIDPTHPMYDKALAAKYGDAIRSVYRRADGFVAEVMEMVEPGTTIMVVSDHGFHSWRKSVNLNTWLVQQGYMVLNGQTPGEKKLDDLFGAGEFWENVDWSRTRAYAMGLGQIYFNLRGREARGIVSPGQEALALADEISSKLRAHLVDPDNGQHIARAVYKRDDVYKGEFLGEAADLQVGFEDGYRVSWQTTLGGSPQGIVYPNMKKWSGDHGGFDYATTAGVLVTNRPISTTAPKIIDIAPTVLSFYGIQAPGSIDGKALFASAPGTRH